MFLYHGSRKGMLRRHERKIRNVRAHKINRVDRGVCYAVLPAGDADQGASGKQQRALPEMQGVYR